MVANARPFISASQFFLSIVLPALAASSPDGCVFRLAFFVLQDDPQNIHTMALAAFVAHATALQELV